jgi:hypothetical protein
MKIKSLPGVKVSLMAITIILFGVFTNIRTGQAGDWRNTIHNDAKGYYAYLPSVFIYQQLNFNFFLYADSALQLNKSICDYRFTVAPGERVNKYYAGTAVAQIPFFIVAHLYALADPEALADGYSYPYMYGIGLAAIFYCILGLFYLDKILLHYNITSANRIITLWATAFGTNVFAYTIAEPGMSHIYSFAFVAIFAYHLLQWFKNYGTLNLLYAAAALGLIMLMRPVNIIVIFFIPFLAGSANNLITAAKQWAANPRTIGITLLVPLAIISIQLILYGISTNHFFIYSYGNEGFNFLHPKVFAILFSYKKGLFVYTPIALVALLGTLLFARQSLYKGVTFFIAFLGITYVLSSWWCWWYGGSFSGRAFIEYYPLLMIGLAAVLNAIKTKLAKAEIIILLVACVYLNQVQTLQYRHGVLHWDSTTKETYWLYFLKTN